jgi:hypothetical protein
LRIDWKVRPLFFVTLPSVKDLRSTWWNLLGKTRELPLTLKDPGGGAAAALRSGDCLPFLTGSCYGHKNSWLCPYTSQQEVGKVIFLLSWQVFQIFSRDRQKITIFWDRKIRNWLFFIFFKTKVCNLFSNINDDCSKLSFEVYNVFVAQKLKILENAK